MADSGTKPNQGKVEDLKTQAKDMGQHVTQKAGDVASTLKDKAHDIAGQARDKAQDLAGQAKDKAQDMATAARDKAEDAMGAVGNRLSGLADRIRETAPHEGVVGSAASTVAEKLHSGGQYLQQHSLRDVSNDLTAMVRSYPIQALLVGVGIGYLVAMATSRRA